MTGDSTAVARALFAAMASGSGAMGDALLQGVAADEAFDYWRIQTDVGGCSFTMDDSTGENVACLEARGRDLVRERQADLEAIAAAISR